jgi:hypothetical protein
MPKLDPLGSHLHEDHNAGQPDPNRARIIIMVPVSLALIVPKVM